MHALEVVSAWVQQPGTFDAEDVTWVRWNAAAAERYPAVVEAIEAFDPGPREAAQSAATWLREAGLAKESVPYLALVGDPWELVGFYALTMGHVELSSGHRKKLGFRYPVQGAVLITQLAKSAQHGFPGSVLVEDALGVAAELSEGVAATLVAVDPYDTETDAMWRNRFKLRASRTELRVMGDDGPLRRLYLPLRDPRPGAAEDTAA